MFDFIVALARKNGKQLPVYRSRSCCFSWIGHFGGRPVPGSLGPFTSSFVAQVVVQLIAYSDEQKSSLLKTHGSKRKKRK